MRDTPWLYWTWMPVTILLILSTVVLGYHYLLDVPAGVILGCVLCRFLPRGVQSSRALHRWLAQGGEVGAELRVRPVGKPFDPRLRPDWPARHHAEKCHVRHAGQRRHQRDLQVASGRYRDGRQVGARAFRGDVALRRSCCCPAVSPTIRLSGDRAFLHPETSLRTSPLSLTERARFVPASTEGVPDGRFRLRSSVQNPTRVPRLPRSADASAIMPPPPRQRLPSRRRRACPKENHGSDDGGLL